MPQLGILFDLSQLDDPVHERGAFRVLFSVVGDRELAGCSLYHGYVRQRTQYCITVHCDSVMALGAVRNAVRASGARGFAEVSQRFLEEGPPREDRMVLAAEVDWAGQLRDVRPDWLPAIWNQTRAVFPAQPAPVPPAPVEQAALPPPAAPPRLPETPAAAPPVPPPAPEGAPQSAAAPLRFHAQFPKSVPPALAAAAGSRTVAAIIGVLAGVLVSLVLFLASPRSTLLFEMFDFRRPSTAIPVAILAMFFWGAAICVLRWRRLRALESISGKALLDAAIPLVGGFHMAILEGDLRGPEAQASPLLRRMGAVLQQWRLRPSLQDADVVLQQIAASDEETVHSGYSLARTFVWALPVLGLIGTVIGIAVAVGGFARFLGGNIDDVTIIKQNLVNVTSGLSFAFLITLLGLLTSLLLMLAASALQTRERELYARVQQEMADLFVPALQRVAPEAPGTETAATPGVKILPDALGEQVAALRRGIELVLEQWTRELDARQAEWQRQLAAAGAGIGAEVSRNGSRLIAELAGQAEATRAAASTLSALAETTGQVLQRQAGLQEAVRALDSGAVQKALESFTAALGACSAEVRAVAGVSEELARLTQQVIASQVALQSATRQLAEADFAATLRDFRDSLSRLAPVLASFQRPFVLQAVPVARENPG
jgi:biopolymer transport protein ExbB/TolQ